MAKFVQAAGPDYCDSGSREGMLRYGGNLYLTAAEQARLDLSGELLIITPDQFELAGSDDPVKTDLELTCAACRERLCDAEAGDDLASLARMAAEHVCKPAGEARDG